MILDYAANAGFPSHLVNNVLSASLDPVQNCTDSNDTAASHITPQTDVLSALLWAGKSRVPESLTKGVDILEDNDEVDSPLSVSTY